jgi:tyrosine-protein phosphatase YwqE
MAADGSSDLADSLAMGAAAHAGGTAAACATPHIRDDHDVDVADLPRRLDDVRSAVRDAGLTITVLPGGEALSCWSA